jgi:glyceraldehyde-3-phosphate dehydrogenase (NADP+)
MSNTSTSIFRPLNKIPDEFKIFEIHQREYLCDGEIKEWTGEIAPVYSPVCTPGEGGLERKLIGTYPVCTTTEAREALSAAVKAYDSGRGEWPTMPVEGRLRCMKKFVSLMSEQRDLIIKLLMWEIGKSEADATKEFDRTVEYIDATMEAFKDLDRKSSRFELAEGLAAQIRRAPLGVVLCMGPFNYPLNETFTTLIPSIIMGNTLLFKPPKHGTLLHYPLLKAFQDSFPKGVVNSVYGRGSEVIPGLMESGKIDVLAFIGSSKVASDLKKRHPKINRLRAVLSLDAKNAAIVTAKADTSLAVAECVLGALSFNGQRCTAIKIIFVHEDIAEEFVQMLSLQVSKLKAGLPWDSGVKITPLPEPNKPKYLKGLVDEALEKGAAIMNDGGGEFIESFYNPAVVYPVQSNMRLYWEEQFGPVIPVVPYKTIDEPIQYQIDSPHGMQVSIFSNDVKEISSLIDPFVNLVSRVNINSQCQRGPDVFPFTGRKDSAEGTLSVSDALRAFSIRSLVSAKMSEMNKKLINQIVIENDSNFLSTKFIL